MGYSVKCPNCNEINTGVETQCKKCQTSLIGCEMILTPAPVDDSKPFPNNTQEKMGFLPFVFGGLSFIPLCGVPFGIISILWGLLTKKRGGKILALIGVLGIGFTVALYGGLYYFGFVERGGVYDSLRTQLAETNLLPLVQAIEFYKVQNGNYPADLPELVKSQPENQSVIIYDPTSMTGQNTRVRLYYYEVLKDGSGYYLLGLGVDGKPFTSDDILPKIDTKNIGLRIHPDSVP